MSLVFLFFSLFFAWLAWNLYYPSYSERGMVISFAAGWLAGELAPHVIFWQVVTVAFFVLIGAVWGFFGALGFLICIASWAAIAFYYYEASFAKNEVAHALSDSLGPDFESDINEPFRERFVTEPDRNHLLHPFRFRDPEVEVIKNIPFGDYGQRLDIRRPRSVRGEDALPVLLQIHGGGWTYGSKNEQALPLMRHMAKRDWICVASSYRLSPSATFPDHIIDCKQALVWIKENIAEFGGDPDFVVVTGGSAGGHLAALLALTPNFPSFQPGFEDKETTVQGAVPFYGLYDFLDVHDHQHHQGVIKFLESTVLKLSSKSDEEAFKDASPYHQIHKNAPPFLVIHGDKDSLIPVDAARTFADELEEISDSSVTYLELAGAQHAFDMFPSIRSEYVKFGVEKFLTWVYSNHLRSLPRR